MVRHRPRHATDTEIALVIAAGGWLVAIALFATGCQKRRGAEKQKSLLIARDYLTGRTQRRRVGIAIIEGLWNTRPEYQRTLLLALINQAVYLLLEKWPT